MSRIRFAGVCLALLLGGGAAVLLAPDSEGAAGTCLATVTTQAELEDCIVTFNAAGPNTTITATLGADITLTSALTQISNSAADFVLDGSGHKIDADSTAANVLSIFTGEATIREIEMTGASSAGLLVSSAFVDVVDSTIHGNNTGIRAVQLSIVKITQSTIADNVFNGVEVRNQSLAGIVQSTIANNGSAGIDLDGTFGLSPGDADVLNSVVARNADAQCDLPIRIDLGGNHFEDFSCSAGGWSDGIADTLAPALAPNGCVSPCTPTVALLPGSLAIDAAGGCTFSTDQRGQPRAQALCDSGAYEAFDCNATPFLAGDETALNYSIGCFNNTGAGSNTDIELTASVALTAPAQPINNGTTAELHIDGGGHAIDGSGIATDVIRVEAGKLFLTDTTLVGGTGDGLDVRSGVIEVRGSTFASNGGYGIFATSSGSNVTLFNSTVAQNGTGGMLLTNGADTLVWQGTIVDNLGVGVSGSTGTGSNVSMRGSLVARNSAACAELLTLDIGGNVFGDTTCNGATTVGLGASLGAGLAANGCAAPCTETVALLAGSPAIDVSGTCGLDHDQRGIARPIGECDAGAFELVIPDAFCNGLLVTIDMNLNGGLGDGTAGADVILGTAGPDTIRAGAGDDTICGGAGADTIRGGAGSDEIFGEGGGDMILGGGGADIIDGGPGADEIRGQGGTDTIDGGDGADTIDGQGAADTISGGEGSDEINGQNGADIIDGGPGIDDIKGQTGPDTLRGDGSGDTLFGGDGADTLYGGPGIDKCAGNTGPDSAEASTCEQTPGVETLF